ncbi:MAG: MazG nucleotide pyrophosphohydrolase domain-containing protein [Minisyncoccia bacterium]
MHSFSQQGSLADFQEFIKVIYGEHDDRFYSIWDLAQNVDRFAMRALKGIRKKDEAKLVLNLLIALSWMMAIANRFHIETESGVLRRFPMQCSYCGKRPCACKAIHPKERILYAGLKIPEVHTIAQLQDMFREIYPPETRTLDQAGVHLAEEIGEVNEAIHAYMGEHKEEQMRALEDEIADALSCVFGVANSINLDVAKKLSELYGRNCHACHKDPCSCTFSSAVLFQS